MNWKIVTRGWGRRLPVIFRHDIIVSNGTSFPFKLENIGFLHLICGQDTHSCHLQLITGRSSTMSPTWVGKSSLRTIGDCAHPQENSQDQVMQQGSHHDTDC